LQTKTKKYVRFASAVRVHRCY